MPYCSACGYELGDPEEDLHDPDGLAGIVEGGVSNEGTAHIVVIDGPKGMRMQCQEMGQMAKLVNEDPGSPSGGEGDKAEPETPKRNPKPEKVYDLEEERSSEDLVRDVVANPVYGLNDDQIVEVGSWVEIYDGQIPPDKLEAVLGNLKGVSKQKAQLMRSKYEAMLNKQVRKQAESNRGPSIGALASPGHVPPNPGPQNGGGHQGQVAPQPPRQIPDRPTEPDDPNDIREKRRKRRVERRQDVMDEVTEEMARSWANEMGKGFAEFRDLIMTLLKSKAKKDPDWFFEKADELGVDIIEELSEPSEARKREMEMGRGGTSADSEIDRALQEMAEPDGHGTGGTQHVNGEHETTNRGPPQGGNTDTKEQDKDDELGPDKQFEEIFGE